MFRFATLRRSLLRGASLVLSVPLIELDWVLEPKQWKECQMGKKNWYLTLIKLRK